MRFQAGFDYRHYPYAGRPYPDPRRKREARSARALRIGHRCVACLREAVPPLYRTRSRRAAKGHPQHSPQFPRRRYAVKRGGSARGGRPPDARPSDRSTLAPASTRCRRAVLLLGRVTFELTPTCDVRELRQVSGVLRLRGHQQPRCAAFPGTGSGGATELDEVIYDPRTPIPILSDYGRTVHLRPESGPPSPTSPRHHTRQGAPSPCGCPGRAGSSPTSQTRRTRRPPPEPSSEHHPGVFPSSRRRTPEGAQRITRGARRPPRRAGRRARTKPPPPRRDGRRETPIVRAREGGG